MNMTELLALARCCDTDEEKRFFTKAFHNFIVDSSKGYWINEIGERFPDKPYDPMKTKLNPYVIEPIRYTKPKNEGYEQQPQPYNPDDYEDYESDSAEIPY